MSGSERTMPTEELESLAVDLCRKGLSWAAAGIVADVLFSGRDNGSIRASRTPHEAAETVARVIDAICREGDQHYTPDSDVCKALRYEHALHMAGDFVARFLRYGVDADYWRFLIDEHVGPERAYLLLKGFDVGEECER